MRYLLIVVLLVAVVINAGCVSEKTMNLFRPKPTPVHPNYLNCSGTWYYGDNQTCCGHTIYTKQDNFQCYGEEYLQRLSINEINGIFSQMSNESSSGSLSDFYNDLYGNGRGDPAPEYTHNPLGPPPTITPQPAYTSVKAIPTIAPAGGREVVVTYKAVPAAPVKVEPVTVKYDPPKYKAVPPAPVKAVPVKK